MSEASSQPGVEPTADLDSKPEPETKDNGSAEEVSPAKKLKLANDVNEEKPEPAVPAPKGRQKNEKKLSMLAKTAKEGQELLKTLGHNTEDDDPDSNRRRTRSQTRGTPPAAAPTTTRKSSTPKTPKQSSNQNDSTTPKRRGRPPKNAPVNNELDNDKASQQTNNKQPAADAEPEIAGIEVDQPDSAVNDSKAAEDGHNDSSPAPVSAVDVGDGATEKLPSAAEMKANLNSSADTSSNAPPVEAN